MPLVSTAKYNKATWLNETRARPAIKEYDEDNRN